MQVSVDWSLAEAAFDQRQCEVARLADEACPWTPPGSRPLRVAAVFVAFPTGRPGPGAAGDPACAAAVLWEAATEGSQMGATPARPAGSVVAQSVVDGVAGAPYVAGRLGLRAGALSEGALRSLLDGLPAGEPGPDLLLVDATGRDHPRRAGLALHLGLVLAMPSVGVTNRALVAAFEPPAGARGAVSPLLLDGRAVGSALRSRPGVNPVLVHAGWRTDPDTALAAARRLIGRWRTPEPLRLARHAARVARARAEGRFPE